MEGQGQDTSVRAMTFNISFETAGDWQQRRPRVAEAIRRWAPDVAGIQEAMEGQIADLRADLPEYEVVPGVRSGQSRMPFWAVTISPVLAGAGLAVLRGRSAAPAQRALGGALLFGAAVPVFLTANGLLKCGTALIRGAYNPILYRKDRYRLVEQQDICMSERPDDPRSFLLGTWLPRVANRARLERVDGGFLDIYNAHVDWMPWGPETSGRLLRSRMDRNWDGSPQVLLGDLNAELDGDAPRELMRPRPGPEPPRLRDAWCEAPRREGPENTCEEGIGIGPCPGRPDHIMIRGDARIERTVTLPFPPGSGFDHAAVVADLRLPAPESLRTG